MTDKIKVDLELRERWLQALESGAYKQGSQYLRTCKDEFCCLGVLATLSGVEWHQRAGEPELVFQYETETGAEQFAFSDRALNMRVGILGYATDLAEMNDTGSSFAEIAAYIREQGIRNEQ